MTIAGGALTTARWFIVGYGPGSNGTINMESGTVNMGAHLYVGFDGLGTQSKTALRAIHPFEPVLVEDSCVAVFGLFLSETVVVGGLDLREMFAEKYHKILLTFGVRQADVQKSQRYFARRYRWLLFRRRCRLSDGLRDVDLGYLLRGLRLGFLVTAGPA